MDGFPRRFGGYVLAKPLARGGMGALYLAVHGQRGLEKLCAVKTALPHLAGKSYVQRFKDEANVVVRLSHGNLVGVFDAGQVKGEIYLAMEFVEGKDLRAVWNRCAQKGIAFPVPVAVHIVKELARGLAYAHSFEGLNLVHRDVSPPNVLLSYSGEVKLTDFGLATSTLKLEKTAPGVIFGKVSYMAPEQARAEALDGRTDMYSAAVILWELLTGRQLFATGAKVPNATQDDLLERVRHPEIVKPSQRASRVPPELDEIVMKALASRPEDRYPNCEAFRSDLAAFLAKTAPAMDGHQVARFLRELFGDVMTKEREERAALLASARALLESHSEQVAALRAESSDSKNERAETTPLGLRDRKPVPKDTGRPIDEGSRMVGALLGGRYQIRRLCGEGGMGRVYEAEHIEIGKRVAIKVLHPAYSRTPDLVERFRREARAASRIEHPNVVSVTDFGNTDDGLLFFVMEYIEGIELGLLIHREGPLPITRALRIAEQMCGALQAAHTAGVIHRDLKPENILLLTPASTSRSPSSPDGSPPPDSADFTPDFVKVLDFGIAKSAEIDDNSLNQGKRLTRPGVAMGTPEYMAPEQAAGHPADPRSDIYSVGSIIYEMLTGSAPYDGENVMEVLHKKANEAPPPLADLRPDIPPQAVALVERAMARSPDHRPQSMADLAREIRVVEQAIAAMQSPPPAMLGQVPERISGRRESLPPVGADSGATGTPTRNAGKRWIAVAAALVSLTVVAVIVRASHHPASQAEESKSAASAHHEGTVKPSPVLVAQAASEPEGQARLVGADAGTERGEGDAGERGDSEPAPGSPRAHEARPTEENPSESKREPVAHARPSRPAAAPAPSAEEERKLLETSRDLLRAQRYEEARVEFKKLATSKRARGPALVGLAKIAFQQKDYQEAVARAREGARVGGGVEARVVLGDAYFRLEQYSDARKAYEEALKLDPDNRTARQNLQLVEPRGN